MFAGQEVGLELVLLAVALLVPVLVVVAFRRMPRNALLAPQTDTSFLSLGSPHANEAILLVQSGGRVEYVNELAREWFGLRPDEPSGLERLLRRTRPAEEFLDLCVHPGQKRLSVGGHLVEVTSYQVPGPYVLMLVIMRNVELSKSLEGSSADSSVLQIITDFGRNITASLDLDETLHAILLNVSHLVPADLMELKTWDYSHQNIMNFTLEASGSAGVRRVSHSQFGGLTDVLTAHQKPLLVPDTRAPDESIPSLNGNSPVQSYLGFPLVADNDLIGTLEVGHLSSGALGQHDLDMLQLVAGQAAYSIRNSLRYEAEQDRLAELNGLASLSQAFVGSSQDYAGLLKRLIESVAPLFSVDILGFLLFDEGKKTLQAQAPFQGLPSHIVDIYRTVIQPDTPAEKIILEQKPIITSNAANDQAWRDSGSPQPRTSRKLA